VAGIDDPWTNDLPKHHESLFDQVLIPVETIQVTGPVLPSDDQVAADQFFRGVAIERNGILRVSRCGDDFPVSETEPITR